MIFLKRTSLLILLFFCFTIVKAEEGMWTISNLNPALVLKM